MCGIPYDYVTYAKIYRNTPERKSRRREILKLRRKQTSAWKKAQYKKEKVKHHNEVNDPSLCVSGGCHEFRSPQSEYCFECKDIVRAV